MSTQTSTTIRVRFLLVVGILLFPLHGVGFFSPRTAIAAPAATALSQRYVVLLNGIRSSSDGATPLQNSFESIQKGLREIGVNRFVYFSYSAAWHMQVGDLYCSGWGDNGCSRTVLGDLSSLDQIPLYEVSHTQLPPDQQAKALDWLLGQIVKADPSAQIDLVGFSLGGIIASRWAALYGATSPLRSHIHGMVVVESPVGGIYGARAVLEGGFRGVVVTEFIKSYFGPDVLRALQVPEEGVSGSIVSSLPEAARFFNFTSIQSTIDYLVNSSSQAVCAGYCWFYKDFVVLGVGTQYWAPKHVRHIQNLGGREVPPGETVSLDEFKEMVFDNHSRPLRNTNTVTWIKEAISTNPIIVTPGTSTIVKTITTPTIPVKPDIMLLADTTGSMGDAIANVQAKANSVMQQIKAVQPDAQFGVAQYKDYFCDAQPYRLSQAITADTNAIQTAIDTTWNADGGCDWPEAQLNAFYQLATSASVGWRSGSNRIIAWFGDAPGHDPSNDITLNAAINALKAANIRVIAIDVNDLDGCAETCGQATAITNATSGRLLRLGSTASSSLASQRDNTNSASKTDEKRTKAVTAEDDDVAGAILAGIQSLPTIVEPRVSDCGTGVSVTFDPPSKTVTSGESATFNVTITVAPGVEANTCQVTYLLNDSPVTDDSSFNTPIIIPITWTTSPPSTTTTQEPEAKSDGWTANEAVVTLLAADKSGGSGIRHITYSATGPEPLGTTIVYGNAALIRITKPGQTTITYFATDNTGNVESPKTFVIKVLAKAYVPLAGR